MNSKTVLNKILSLLSKDEVVLTYAKLADGTIVESATFDVGEDLFVVSEDGTKSPAPNGTHDLMLRDEEGNENLIKVITEDGKIVERENVELETVKVEEIPQASGDLEKVNEVPDQKNQVASGTLNMAEETEEVMPIPEDATKEDEAEIEIELGKKLEEMAYRIEEMEKKMMKMEEAMMPPVDQTVNEEVAMSSEPDEDEELPKLDGAPIEEGYKFAAENRKNYGKKVVDSQSSFLSKLYK
jgi:flagellar biosynthesis GTPase FlhF